MADTIINTHDGTFKTEGSISLDEARLFMNNRTGVDIAEEDNSLENLFTVAAANGITLPNTNGEKPYSISELYGMSYQNNTPPVISLLGPWVIFNDTNKQFLLPLEYNPPCNPTSSQLSGFVYDDDHFVYTVHLFSRNYFSGWGQIMTCQRVSFYCYGSDPEAFDSSKCFERVIEPHSGYMHGYVGRPWEYSWGTTVPFIQYNRSMYKNATNRYYEYEDAFGDILGSRVVAVQFHNAGQNPPHITGTLDGIEAEVEKCNVSKPLHRYIKTRHQRANNSWQYHPWTAWDNAVASIPSSSKTYAMPGWCSGRSDNSNVNRATDGFNSVTASSPTSHLFGSNLVKEAVGTQKTLSPRPWDERSSDNATSLYYADIPTMGGTKIKPLTGNLTAGAGWQFPAVNLNDVEVRRTNNGLTTNHLNFFNTYVDAGPAHHSIHPIKQL